MKTLSRILILVVISAFVTSGVLAQEMMGKKDKEGDAQSPMMQGMMGGNMMCPMCGKMTSMMQGKMGDQGMMDKMIGLIGKMDLSMRQQATIDGFLFIHQKDMIRKKADLQIAEIELGRMMRQEKVDLGAIEDKIKHIASLTAKMRFAEVVVQEDVKSVLTNGQKMNLRKMMKDKDMPMMMEMKSKTSKPEQKDKQKPEQKAEQRDKQKLEQKAEQKVEQKAKEKHEQMMKESGEMMKKK